MTFVTEVNGHDTNGRKRASGAAAATQQLVQQQHSMHSLDRVRALELGRSQEQARAGAAASERAQRASEFGLLQGPCSVTRSFR